MKKRGKGLNIKRDNKREYQLFHEYQKLIENNTIYFVSKEPNKKGKYKIVKIFKLIKNHNKLPVVLYYIISVRKFGRGAIKYINDFDDEFELLNETDEKTIKQMVKQSNKYIKE